MWQISFLPRVNLCAGGRGHPVDVLLLLLLSMLLGLFLGRGELRIRALDVYVVGGRVLQVEVGRRGHFFPPRLEAQMMSPYIHISQGENKRVYPYAG